MTKQIFRAGMELSNLSPRITDDIIITVYDDGWALLKIMEGDKTTTVSIPVDRIPTLIGLLNNAGVAGGVL